MAKFNLHNEFGSQRPQKTADAQICAQTEALLADAVDGSLDPEFQTIFDDHIATCVRCSLMLADARRGAAWLEMLKSHAPEPPRDMVSRILAQTSVQTSLVQTSFQTSAPAAAIFADTPFADQPSLVANLPTGIGADLPISALRPSANVLPFRTRVAANLRPPRSWKRSWNESWKHTVFQPRLAMTAAMAFFSVALTLDVTGIHLNQLRASELRPSNLKRSFYAADAHVARYYDNLRVVYELESRVHDLQRSSADDSPTPTQQPDIRPEDRPQDDHQPKPGKQDHPAPSPGTSRRRENAPNNSADRKIDRTSQAPGILALANLPVPLPAPFPAHNPPPAPHRIAAPIASAPAPKERGDLA